MLTICSNNSHKNSRCTFNTGNGRRNNYNNNCINNDNSKGNPKNKNTIILAKISIITAYWEYVGLLAFPKIPVFWGLYWGPPVFQNYHVPRRLKDTVGASCFGAH